MGLDNPKENGKSSNNNNDGDDDDDDDDDYDDDDVDGVHAMMMINPCYDRFSYF